MVISLFTRETEERSLLVFDVNNKEYKFVGLNKSLIFPIDTLVGQRMGPP